MLMAFVCTRFKHSGLGADILLGRYFACWITAHQWELFYDGISRATT